jgi:hypothetical protein
LVLFFEIAIRTVFIEFARLFTGYMLITNWLTVFLLGMYMHQQKDNHNNLKAMLVVLLWAVLLFTWASVINLFYLTNSFPFRVTAVDSTLISSIVISIAITFVYLGNTLLAVKCFSRIPSNKVVRFFSRNTIFIFIGHMPLYDVAEPIARIFVESGWGKRAIIVFIMYVGLAFVSELLHKLVDINKLKTSVWNRISK